MNIQVIFTGDTTAEILDAMHGFIFAAAQAEMNAAPTAVKATNPEPEQAAEEKPKKTRAKKTTKPAKEKSNITDNPEDRQNPEDEVQDAEDEAAEEDDSDPLTLDDVRDAAGGYVNKFGMEAAQIDLMACLKQAVGVEKISQLPDDQDTLAKAIAAFEDAAAADKRYGQ